MVSILLFVLILFEANDNAFNCVPTMWEINVVKYLEIYFIGEKIFIIYVRVYLNRQHFIINEKVFECIYIYIFFLLSRLLHILWGYPFFSPGCLLFSFMATVWQNYIYYLQVGSWLWLFAFVPGCSLKCASKYKPNRYDLKELEDAETVSKIIWKSHVRRNLEE